MQGVSINIFVKNRTEKKDELRKVFHFDLQGKRGIKYDYLNFKNIKDLKWKLLNHSYPYHFFVPKDFGLDLTYKSGFKSR